MKKNILRFGLDVMSRVCFAFIFMTSSPIQRANIVAQNFIGFQAKIQVFRVLDRVSSASGSKVMLKKFQIFSGIPNEYSIIFAITFQLETLECQSNPLKTRPIA